ncbi:ribonuclease inhibitor [Streptomyces sp. NPDC051214]|uniref:ribonuclease inhibitor n=1 Tax=Streptomyces sp. NPDC051214 TaxID=3155282 RepID=UPI0034472BED
MNDPSVTPQFAGVPRVEARPLAELDPLLAWLRGGKAPSERVDFATGTALPDGRLDLCKQAIGPQGAALIAGALRADRDEQEPAVRHLLLGTDGLGDEGAAVAAAAATGETGPTGVETLYLGCNGITAGGACRIADQLRASPQVVTGLWLKRNPLGPGAGAAATELIESVRTLRTLDLVQTGLDAAGAAALADALLTAAGAERGVERVFLGGNPLGPSGAAPLAELIARGGVRELYVSAAALGDEGALLIAEGLERAEPGGLDRLALASNSIGPRAAARLVAASVTAGVRLLDLGRVRAAGTLGAADNHIDDTASGAIAESLAAVEHRLSHLVLAHTGLRSREAHRLLDTAAHARTPTRFVLGQGIEASIKRRLAALSAHIPAPSTPRDVAAVRSVHR